MEDYVIRMIEEQTELCNRAVKLQMFIMGEKYNELPEDEKTDLRIQVDLMLSYADLLKRRILRAVNEVDYDVKIDKTIRPISLQMLWTIGKISTKCYKGLTRKEFNTLQDVADCSPRELLKIHNFGRKSLQEIEECMYESGLEFKGNRYVE